MLIEHLGKSPIVDPTAYIAPNAVICGDVTIGPGVRILFSAQVVAEGGSVEIGRECIVMENAVLRSSATHPLILGANCLVGPNAHVVGSHIEDGVFLATGCAVFHGSHLGTGVEVRVHGVVHLRTHVAAGTVVPIGWVAVGNPAQLFPACEHEAIWKVQEPLNFPRTVYGLERGEARTARITQRLSQTLASHFGDREVNQPRRFAWLTGKFEHHGTRNKAKLTMLWPGFCTHSLRATAATNALDHEADIAKVQEWLAVPVTASSKRGSEREPRK